MRRFKTMKNWLTRPSDALIPAAFSIAALLGRGDMALWLFLGFYAVKLGGLATANGLRAAFARQPSTRYVQGSAVVALLAQVVGTILAVLAALLTGQRAALYPLVLCGLLLNIEQVFYEYLYAVGERQSAVLCRGLTALLTLTGLLLGAKSAPSTAALPDCEPLWPLITSGLSAAIGLVIGLCASGSLKPKLNADVLRDAPLSMLQTFLYPALALAGLRFLAPSASPALPLFLGLTLYEACRTPFRRSPRESVALNRFLLGACAALLLCGAVWFLAFPGQGMPTVPAILGALLLAALCAFGMYGNIRREA